MNMNIPKNKIEIWLPHIIGLLLFLILPIFVFDIANERSIYWIYSYYYQLLFMIVAFYVNYLVIVPRYFFLKNRIRFFVILFLFAIALLFISRYLYDILEFDNMRHIGEGAGDLRPKKTFGMHPKIIENFFLMLVVLGFSSGMAIIQRLKKNEVKQKEIEKARVDSELAFLKNQISPHFFFNSLNSIYALIAIDKDKAQQSVEKLSVLMRYLIYDSNIETVELKKELDFTWKYIELMQQRLSPKVKLEVNIEKTPPDVKIAPLLFIPFVENAFKHGISYRQDSFISMSLRTDENYVIFESKNSIPAINESKEKKGCVGIENIKKRLDLIYTDSFELKINNTEKEYSVMLKLPLDIEDYE